MAKTIPKRVLEDIRFRNDIADVIGSYINLQRAGSNFKALCPFHKEKTPSFHVNAQRQIFHCFGCGAGGDVFKFVMQYEGLDFMGAIRMLASRAGVAIEMEEGEGHSDRQKLFEIHAEIAKFYERCLAELPGAEAARAYLKKRELDVPGAKPFRIGHAPDRWDSCVQWAAKHKVDLDLMEKSGLVIRSERPSADRTHHDRFRNRVMFPILDEQSRVIGFSGRALAEGEPAKYVNSPETPIFQKGRVLYALHAARRAMVDSREAILCEGQIDVIRCHIAGFGSAVASQGTAFTEDHARMLRRYADSVVIVFDPDRAGQDAAVRSARIFLEAGLSVRVASLPAGEDPDVHIRKHGADGFAGVLRRAESVVAFQMRTLGGRDGAAGEAGMRRIIAAVIETAGGVHDPILRESLIQEIGRAFPAVNIAALYEEFRLQRSRAMRRGGEQPPDAGKPAPQNEVPQEEKELCRHLSHLGEAPDLAGLVKQYLPAEMLTHPFSRAFVETVLQGAVSGRKTANPAFADDPPGLQAFAAEVQMAPSLTRGIRTGKNHVLSIEFTRSDAVKGLILKLWKTKFEAERAELQSSMAGRELTASEQERWRQVIYDIRAMRNWEEGRRIVEIELAGGGE